MGCHNCIFRLAGNNCQSPISDVRQTQHVTSRGGAYFKYINDYCRFKLKCKDEYEDSPYFGHHTVNLVLE